MTQYHVCLEKVSKDVTRWILFESAPDLEYKSVVDIMESGPKDTWPIREIEAKTHDKTHPIEIMHLDVDFGKAIKFSSRIKKVLRHFETK